MRKITIDEHQLIDEIARIHESMCEYFIADYQTNEMETALRSESLKLQLAAQDELFVIEEGSIIAFIWISPAADHIYIKSTYVHPLYRNNGVATLMKQKIEQYAVRLKKRYIITKVADSNTAMRQLNKKLGYIDMGEYMKKEVRQHD